MYQYNFCLKFISNQQTIIIPSIHIDQQQQQQSTSGKLSKLLLSSDRRLFFSSFLVLVDVWQSKNKSMVQKKGEKILML